MQKFGVDYVAFSKMAADCPLHFLHLTFICCQVGYLYLKYLAFYHNFLGGTCASVFTYRYDGDVCVYNAI
jgi:hypothetical protein